MASHVLQAEVLVLTRGEPRESCTPYEVLCVQQGVLRILQRRGKGSGGPTLDLFDKAFLELSGEGGQAPWFVKEVRIDKRHTGIAARYEALALASRFTTLLARNPLPDYGREKINELASNAVASFSNHPQLAEIVYLKACFSFAKDEGYPMRQQWLADLHGSLRDEAQTLLSSTLLTLETETWARPAAVKLIPRLEHYIREHTDIHLPA